MISSCPRILLVKSSWAFRSLDVTFAQDKRRYLKYSSFPETTPGDRNKCMFNMGGCNQSCSEHGDHNPGVGGSSPSPATKHFNDLVVSGHCHSYSLATGDCLGSWHRRHAIMLASQLPETPADAVIIL